MKKTPPPDTSKTTTEIAREAFILLSKRRLAPTPEAYRTVFNEVAGLPDEETPPAKPEKTAKNTPAESPCQDILKNLAEKLSKVSEKTDDLGKKLLTAHQQQNWAAYQKSLDGLVEKLQQPQSTKPAVAPTPPPAPVVISPPVPPDNKPQAHAEGHHPHVLEKIRVMLVRLLSVGIPALLEDDIALVNESQAIANELKTAQSPEILTVLYTRLSQLCFSIEIRGYQTGKQQEVLLRLFKLLITNIGELTDDDRWLHGQLEFFNSLTAQTDNLDYRALEEAENYLKDIILKQGLLKQNLVEARNTLKQLMIRFIERLGIMASSTEKYHDRIHDISTKISNTNNIIELNSILSTIVQETQIIQSDTLNSLEQMNEVRQQVDEAEQRIKALENQLEQMSDLVREDKLTGTLNRRGLEDAFEREIARSTRNGAPLCVALLDLDNFKLINDQYGHLVGDDALIHLVRVVKNTIRPTDVIARFGGEEFIVLFPETELQESIHVMQRVQRELTKHFFLHNNERLLITFSAGVAMCKPNEPSDDLYARADAAMYKAKQAGKNCVMSAE